MFNESEPENKTFTAALARMCESELVRLLDRVETLIKDFQHNPRRKGESVAAVAAAQKALKILNDEIKHILMARQVNGIERMVNPWNA